MAMPDSSQNSGRKTRLRQWSRHALKSAALHLPAVSRVFDERDAGRRALASAERDLTSADARAATLAADRDALAAAHGALIANRDALIADRDALAAALEAERLARAQAAEAPPAPQRLGWEGAPDLETKGLFIVGHARSGTSILLEALNDSPEMFLLGEANLHQHGLMPRFAEWYNAMHREFGNPPGKSSYCPPLAGAEANGVECLDALARRHVFVGEKLAFRDVTLGYHPDGFFDFQASHFFNAHYVCVIRDPIAVLRSSAVMFGPEWQDRYARSYLRTLLLILSLYRTFPKVSVLVHERISAGSFRALGGRLGLDLSGSAAYYRSALQASGRVQAEALPPGPLLLRSLFERVCDLFSPDTLRDTSKLDLLRLHADVQQEHAAVDMPHQAIAQMAK